MVMMAFPGRKAADNRAGIWRLLPDCQRLGGHGFSAATLPIASSRISSACVICASVVVSGGVKVSTLPNVVLNDSPFSSLLGPLQKPGDDLGADMLMVVVRLRGHVQFSIDDLVPCTFLLRKQLQIG